MAMNFRAGIEEIQRGGETIERGYQGLASAVGQKFAAQISVMKERRQIEQQNIQAKEQSRQQLFDNAKQAAGMYLQGQQNAMEKERFQWQKSAEEARVKQQDEAKKLKRAAADATNTYYKNVAVPKDIVDPVEQAAWRESYMTQQMTEEDRALKKRQTESTIATQESDTSIKKANLEIARGNLELAKKEAKTKEELAALDLFKPVLGSLAAAKVGAKDPSAAYKTDVNEATIKQHDKAYANLKTTADTVSKSESAMRRFGQLLGNQVPVNGKFTPEQLDLMAKKVKEIKSDSPELFEIKMLATQIAYHDAKSFTGGGNISASEHGLLQSARGTDFSTFIGALDPERKGMFQRAVDSFWKDIFREGQFKAFATTQERTSAKLKEDALREFISNSGLYSIEKSQRADALFQMLPEAQRQELQKDGRVQEWYNKPFDEQMGIVFGDSGKNADISQALARDKIYNSYRNGSIDAIADVTEGQVKAMMATGNDAVKAAGNKVLSMINGYRTQPVAVQPPPSGIRVQASTTPLKYVENGMATPVRTVYNGLPSYRPVRQSSSRYEPDDSWLDLNLDPAKPSTVQINSTFK